MRISDWSSDVCSSDLPGIGKSTLLLQALAFLSRAVQVLYVTGEESAAQVALRAQPLDLSCGDVKLLAEIRLEAIIRPLTLPRPRVPVIDSLPTLFSLHLGSAPRPISQFPPCSPPL